MAVMRTHWVFTLTQWHSCVLNWCSGAVQFSLIGIHAHTMGVQGLFPLTHWHSCVLNGCSGGVQYSLIGVHVHSQAFRGCSIITQLYSHALTSVQGMFSSDTNEINDSMTIMPTQWVFTLTQWCSHSLNGCSGAVPTHSLAFMHT